jgi:tRNA(fMet)-specific endonuclease VapC
MSGKLLDSNAVIALQRGEASLLTLLKPDVEWYIPAVALGELYYGAYNSGRAADNLRALAEVEQKVAILGNDAVTAQLYGEIRHTLKVKGRPTPDNDIWIAATALQHGLILVTRDAHFNEVDRLPLESW